MLPVRVPYKLAPDARVGRLYYVVGPDAGWATPTAAQVVAGLLSGGGAAVAAGSQDSPTLTTAGFVFTPDAAGLTPGVSYRAAAVWWDGASASAVAVSGVFATGAEAAPSRRETLGGRGVKKFDRDTHAAAAAVLLICALVASGELDE